MSTGLIKVLIVDDSAIIRQSIKRILAKDPRIEVIAAVGDCFEAQKMILTHKPDVITLDVEMPGLDGISFLKIIMEKFPTPTIMISTLTQKGSQKAIQAFVNGALDVLGKPDKNYSLADFERDLHEKIKAAKQAVVKPRGLGIQSAFKPIEPKFSAHYSPSKVLFIGASTGGTEAIKEVLSGFPEKIPPVLIVQHIPAHFSREFAKHLNVLFPFDVKEAEDGDLVIPNRVLVAPGDFHMVVEPNKAGSLHVRLHQQDKVWHQRPAVDILFDSAAKHLGKNAIATVLTGMGQDGAEGLLNIRNAKGKTFAQDQESSVIYGMPRVAFEKGGVEQVLSLKKMANGLLSAATAKQTMLFK